MGIADEKFTVILEAWATAISPSGQQTKVAQDRLLICDGCEHKKHMPLANKLLVMAAIPKKTKDNHSNILYNQCGICECPLVPKAYGTNGCPIERWK